MAAIFQTTFSNAFYSMKMYEFNLKFHWSLFLRVQLTISQHLVQIMAWRRPGDKPLSGPMMVKLPTHICVTRPQWVNALNFPILASALACEWIPTYFLPFKVWRFVSQRWYHITTASHGNHGVTNNRQSVCFFKNKLWLSWKKTLKLRNRMWSLGVFYCLSPNKPLNQEFVPRWTYNLPETSASMTLIWRHRNSIL